MRKVWIEKADNQLFKLKIYDEGWPWDATSITFGDKESFSAFIKQLKDLENDPALASPRND